MTDTSTPDPDDTGRPDAEELPDGSGSDGSPANDGEDTASGGGADDD